MAWEMGPVAMRGLRVRSPLAYAGTMHAMIIRIGLIASIKGNPGSTVSISCRGAP